MFKKTAIVLLVAVLFVQAWPACAAEGPVTLGGGTLTALALSPDGTRLASSSEDGMVKAWPVP